MNTDNYYELVLDSAPNNIADKYDYVLYVCDDYYSYPVYDWKNFYKAWKAGMNIPIYDITCISFKEIPNTIHNI